MDMDEQKKAIYERLSSRRKRFIDRIGYEAWDPFQEPKHPIEIRRDLTKRTAKDLFRDFIQSRQTEDYSNAYGRGVYELCMGIYNKDERFKGMFEFCLWYSEQLKERGLKPQDIWDR